MLSPMSTVLVLAVLWLIVVVPMVVQKLDDRAGERSVKRFSGAMRALSKGKSLGSLARPVAREDADRSTATAAPTATRRQVFVPGAPDGVSAAARRPVPAAMEAVMYPDRVDKQDMSEARREMMARRRRTLTLLTAGAVIGMLWSLVSGGTLAYTAAAVFVLSLAGYFYFLRSQALKDQARRENRLRAGGFGQTTSYDATESIPAYYENADSVVRIDDDDVQLHGVADTVDLTGLYQEEEFDERAYRRAV